MNLYRGLAEIFSDLVKLIVGASVSDFKEFEKDIVDNIWGKNSDFPLWVQKNIVYPKLDFSFTKVRDVKSPEKAHNTDMCFDFFVPNDFKETMIWPGESILIPSGIKMIIPEGWSMVFLNKSGIASKKNFVVGSQVVDSHYFGEIHLNVHNIAKQQSVFFENERQKMIEKWTIKPGMKLIQAAIIQVPNVSFEFISEDEYNNITSEIDSKKNNPRGTGGFGSSGE